MKKSVNNNPTLHDMTEFQAAKWLEYRGYNVMLEFSIRVARSRYRVDVYGESNGNEVVIECGHARLEKMECLKENVDSLYIWPLDSTEPILWHKGIIVCKTCGCICPNKLDVGVFDTTEFVRYKAKFGYIKSSGIVTQAKNCQELVGELGNRLHDGWNLENGSVKNDIEVREIRDKESDNRLQQICLLRSEGLTYRQIGKQVGLSYERVRQLLPKGLRGQAVIRDKEIPRSVMAICEYCGKEYPRHRKLQRFCNKECRKNWWITQRHNGHNPNYGITSCVICGTEFQKSRPWSRYCSTCKEQGKRET